MDRKEYESKSTTSQNRHFWQHKMWMSCFHNFALYFNHGFCEELDDQNSANALRPLMTQTRLLLHIAYRYPVNPALLMLKQVYNATSFRASAYST